jgi:hypothetical protein
MISVLILSDEDKLLFNQMGIALPPDFPPCPDCGPAKDTSHVLNHCVRCGSGRTVSLPDSELGLMICMDCCRNLDLRDMLLDF